MELILKNLEPEEEVELSFERKIVDTGMNSIAFIKTIMDIENEFSIMVEDEWLIYDEDTTLQLFFDMVKKSNKNVDNV